MIEMEGAEMKIYKLRKVIRKKMTNWIFILIKETLTDLFGRKVSPRGGLTDVHSIEF
jgi:hypothetical protein